MQVADRILARLSVRLGRDRFSRYFEHQTRVRYSGGVLEVLVPAGFVAELIARKFRELILDAARDEVGPAPAGMPLEVHFSVVPEAFGSAAGSAAATAIPVADGAVDKIEHSPGGASRGPAAAARQHRRARTAAGAAIRYRLEDFVVGDSNRLAFNAGERLTEPGSSRQYSPLFIHGPCGLGKTHLLRGIAARFREHNPGATVLYLPAETFTNDYIADVRSGRIEAFRKKYREVDLLCLDDVQFFSSKPQTQTELLHTFDAIDLSGARLVLASDEHPRQVRKLSNSLVSRFMSGMVVKIDPPEPALREKIVAKLAERRGLKLDAAGCALVAARCGGAAGGGGAAVGSVRDIEGALTRIEAMRVVAPGLSGAPVEAGGSGEVGLMLIRRALGMDEGSAASWRPRRPVKVEQIVDEVCRTLHVEHQELLGRGRHKRVVLARTLAAHLSRQMTTLSFPEIARAMGRPNHSTVVTACKRMQEQIARDDALDLGADTIQELSGLTVKTLAEQVRDDIVRSGPGA